MGVVENRLFLNGRFPLLLIPDGVGVGLEIDGASRVFPPFQNVNNGVGIPMVGIIGFGAWGFDARPALICGGVEHLFLLQELCNLHRASPFHAQLENALDYQCRRFIHDPLCLVLRVFTVAERNIDGQRNASFAFCLIDSTDLAAGVFGEKLLEPVLDARNIAVGTVGVDGVKMVVDGNIANIVLWKCEVDVQPCQRGITPQS